jgi:hypothetical protein
MSPFCGFLNNEEAKEESPRRLRLGCISVHY